MKQLETKIKWKINVKWRYTPFLSLLCPWCLNGQQAGQLVLDSRQGQDVSLLHNIQAGSGAHPASYTLSTEGSFMGDENLSKLWLFLYNAIIIFLSSVISYRIPSNAGYFG
jgi:hypothetical protein